MEKYYDSNFTEENKQPIVQLDIKKLFGKCFRNWYWILAFAAVIVFVAHLYLRYSYPVYQVAARVINKATEEQELSSTFMKASPTAANFSQSLLVNEIELLQSRNLITQVITDLGFELSYYNVGRVKDIEIYPYTSGSPFLVTVVNATNETYQKPIYVESTSAAAFTIYQNGNTVSGQFNKPVNTPFGDFLVKVNQNYSGDNTQVKVVVHDSNQVISDFMENYRVNQVSSAGNAIDISIKHTYPTKAIYFLDKVIQLYDKSIVEDKNRISSRTDEFLEKRIEELSNELKNSEEELLDFQLENNLLANTLDSKSESIRDEFKSLRERSLEIAVLRGQINQLLNLLKNSRNEDSQNFVRQSVFYDFIFYNTNIELPGRNFSGLFKEYVEALREMGDNKMSFSASSPLNAAANNELDSLQQYLANGLTYALNELNIVEKSFYRVEDSLYQELLKVPQLRIPFQKIERLLGLKEQLYFSLLQQREQIKLSQATSMSELKVLMDPRLVARISTADSQVYLYALLGGLLFPILVFAVVIMAENTLESPDEIAKRTNVPVIASIGHSKSKKQIVVDQNTRTGMAEMFRLLRTNLNFFTSTGKKPLLDGELKNLSMLVTSSISGDGKTFIVVNMGMSLAIAGKKVCLVNIDLRKPKLGRYLGKEDEKNGLTKYLAGVMTLDQVIEPTGAHDNLFFIPSGPIPPNPAELLLTERMREAVKLLKEKFEVVIFDAPPIGAVADAFAMEPHVDISLFIVRYRHSRLDSLNLIQNAKDEKKLPNPAIVLNDAREFQNSYSYGYGYGYGYGYYEDDRSRLHWLKKRWKKMFKG